MGWTDFSAIFIDTRRFHSQDGMNELLRGTEATFVFEPGILFGQLQSLRDGNLRSDKAKIKNTPIGEAPLGFCL